MGKVVCLDSKCEAGGNETCCHECALYAHCTDLWKCDDSSFYEDCKTNGGVSVEITFDAKEVK